MSDFRRAAAITNTARITLQALRDAEDEPLENLEAADSKLRAVAAGLCQSCGAAQRACTCRYMP